MTELGARLKAAREEKGYDLEDLQRITKIQKRYLQGIEEGNYDLMPGKFYVRAFIKQYAESVGLHPEQLFDEHANEIPVAQSSELPETLSRVSSRRKVSDSTSKFMDVLPKLLILLLAIGAIVIVWFLYDKYFVSEDPLKENNPTENTVNMETKDNGSLQEESNDESANSEEDNSNSETEEAKPIENTPEPQELSVVEVSGTQTTYALKNAKEFQLELTASKDGASWVEVYNADNEQLYFAMLADGEKISYDLKGNEQALIKIGRILDVTMKLNGEPVKFELEDVSQKFIIQNSPAE
ncbi:helix-turn-helix domain-containing protein [Bacillus sp. 2205SS5-2]|uniref:helix-turn-helix domain-containing protein n=1 Tax=Bacillus sp. 2205SS5-2 TaxID=3109031 RepID=UPI003005C189